MIGRPVFRALALAAVLAPAAVAQRTADFTWQGAVAAGGLVSINNINGDVKVVPSTTGRVEVAGFKHGDPAYFDRIRVDVQPSARGVVICVVFEDQNSYCDDRGYHSNNTGNTGQRRWRDLSMNLEVAVPSNLTVSAGSVSGDIDVSGAQGVVRANSVSGDIRLDRLVASAVHANTVSGDVTVRIDRFSGDGDLTFNTVSGDVTLEVPRQFDADLSMTTVSGRIDSEFELLVSSGRVKRRSVDARIGAGGRRLDLNTVSGDLRLRAIY